MRRLTLVALLLAACQAPEKPIRSLLLSGGSYVRIENRQAAGEVRDSTSLGFFSDDLFSVEIRAAGDSLPSSVSEVLPTLFMIGDEQGGAEVGIFRAPLQDDRILVTMGNQFVLSLEGESSLEVPGCDWNDPGVFTLIVLTYDGVTVKVFGNGTLLASSDINFDIDVAGTDALIGANWGGAPNDVTNLSNFWYGAIDEVRLWRKVIPTSEMQFRYENPGKLTRRYSATGLDPLMGLWRFNALASAGETETDHSDNGNDGVLTAGSGTIAFSTAGP